MIGFLKSSKKKDIFRKTVCYGLVSAVKETDIRGTALALANYFASAKGYKTAFVLAKKDEPMNVMLSKLNCIDVNPMGYSDDYLTYYCISNAEELKKLRMKGFERLVMEIDPEYLDEDYVSETDHVRIFADISPWRYNSIRLFMRDNLLKRTVMRQRSGKCLYSVSSRKIDVKRLKKEFDLDMIETGLISDPYRLDKDDLQKIGKLV